MAGRFFKRTILAISLGYSLAICSHVYALPIGSISVDEAQNIEVETPFGTAVCAVVESSYLAGDMVAAGYFRTYVSKLKALKKKRKKVKGTKKEKKILVQITKTKKKNSVATATCSVLSVSPPSLPALPGATEGNFDIYGNLTATGKAKFGVPSNLEGNISAGSSTFKSFCTCHEAQLNHTFDFYREKTSGAPMFFSTSELSDPALANLTAYLNRFNLP